MTVAMAGLPNAMWTGLSGDTMPTDARVHENDIFFQTDTGLYFLWTGTAWVTYPLGGGGGVDIAAGASTITSATAVFSNANGVSWGIVGNTITASVGTFAAAPVNFSAGTTSNNLGTIVFSNSNNVSVGLNGSTVTWSVNPGGVAVSAAGSSQSAGTVVWSNSNNVSFGMNGSTITATVTVPAQTNQTLGIYASSQTVGQSSSSTVDARSFTHVGQGIVSVGLSAGSLLISATTAAQTNQSLGLYASSQTTAQSSSSTVDARSLTIVGAGNVSVGLSAGSFIVSGATAAGLTTGGGYVQGNTTGQSSSTTYPLTSFNVSAAGNMSAGWSASTLILSNSQSAQTEAIYLAGNTTAQSSQSTYTVSSLNLSFAGLVSGGWSNNSLIISAPNTTSFAAFSAGVSTGGNTSGNTGLVASQLVLAGGNNITLSGSTNGGSMTVTISAANAGGAQTGISGIQVSNTTYTSGTVTFQNANGISFGSSGANGISASYTVPTQTNQTLGLYASSQTTAQSSSSTVDARSLTFVGMGNVSVGLSAGSYIISATGGGGGASTAGFYATGNTTQNSSTTLALSSLLLNGLGAMTAGFSNGSIQLSAPVTSSLSATGNASLFVNGQTISVGANAAAVSIGGNSTSAGAGYSNVSTGTLVLAGGNNITLSQNGASVTISGANAGGAQTGISGIQVSNTTYTSGTVTLQNANGISFGSSGANGISASYTVPTQASFYALGNTTQNSSSVLPFNALSFNGLGEVTVGYSNGSIQISAPPSSIGVSNIGNTAGNTGVYSGQMVLAGGNNITLSVSSAAGGAQTITISGGAGGGGAAISAAGSSQNAGTIVFSNSNNVSFGMNGSTITATATFAQTNQTMGIYASSQTTGSASSYTYDARSLSIIGAGGISVGNNSTSAGGTTTGFLISAPNTSSISGTGLVSIAVNANTISIGVPIPYLSYYENPDLRGNTATTTLANGTVYIQPFAANNYVSAYRLGLLQQVTTQAQTTMSFSGSVSASGTSSGTGEWSQLQTYLLFSRQSTGTAAQSANLISFASTTWSAGVGMSESQSWSTNASSASVTVTTSGAVSFISQIGTNGGVTTGSFGTSGSTTFSSTSNAGNTFSSSFAMTFGSQVMSGIRPINVPFNVSLTPGEYWLGIIQSTASASTNMSLQQLVSFAPGMVVYTTATSAYADFGATSTNNSNMMQGWGSYSSSGNTTTTFPLSNVSGMSNMQTWFNMMAASK